jgi:hypothetical protein
MEKGAAGHWLLWLTVSIGIPRLKPFLILFFIASPHNASSKSYPSPLYPQRIPLHIRSPTHASSFPTTPNYATAHPAPDQQDEAASTFH